MGELINGRTTDDLKDALMRCGRRHCKAESGDCPCYIDCLVGATRLKLMKDAFDYIRYLESERDAALAKVPRWISIQERQPKDGQKVIFINEKYPNITLQGIYKEDGMPDTIRVFGFGIGKVTHWMPLPEPPKEGE